MIRALIVGLVGLPLVAIAQVPPAIPVSAPNPFTGPEAVIDPALFKQQPAAPAANSKPQSIENLIFENQPLPADVRTLLDGIVLVGRTDTYAILGFQMPNTMNVGQVGTGRALRTLTVRHGGSFYLGNHKVALELDADGTGAFIKEARKGGATLWALDIDNQRTAYVPQTMNDAPGSAGVGVGQRVGNSGGSSSSAFGQTPPSTPLQR